jgi:hypothetical protein
MTEKEILEYFRKVRELSPDSSLMDAMTQSYLVEDILRVFEAEWDRGYSEGFQSGADEAEDGAFWREQDIATESHQEGHEEGYHQGYDDGYQEACESR